MGYPERRQDRAGDVYYRARYKIAPGRYGTVKDAYGRTVKFPTKRAATQAANDQEAAERARTAPVAQPVDRTPETFAQFANRWYAGLDLALSTMQNYRNHLETHLLPAFGEMLMTEIDEETVNLWSRSESDRGYPASSIRTWRSTLHVMLGDAVEQKLIPANVATTRRGRGKRAGRSTGNRRGPEKAVVDAVSALIIAERAGILTGRDDEFIAVIMDFYTGMRWGEIVGLKPSFVRPHWIRIEFQLYELDGGVLVEGAPKDDSYRDIDIPRFLSDLLRPLVALRPPCNCHGAKYVFTGPERLTPLPRALIAEAAGVSLATVSRSISGGPVAASTRARVLAARDQLPVPQSMILPHWERDSWRREVFAPAASGWYPRQGVDEPARPVRLLADPWPGKVIRGRHSAAKAQACWSPIEADLTTHGLRHSHRTVMEDLGTPRVLMDDRMGHLDGSVSAQYAHIAPGMVQRLMEDLTGLWEAALQVRAGMHPRSPVAALDQLLQSLSPRSSPIALPERRDRGRRASLRLL
ncbi:LacI family DNA-binding transcriptional regulator [Actinacidiphila sp. ITFR-21]|uniref:LacI family DNA-binding transcriptional regulator n=1 Tax=Actinacidiphila sp. ITFR-21 TaxID=3075199 RepID=UPI002889CF65|nr:LacI family DNA-binding transcriptional regulator [Streptomyces sp. ITFR-21]WNI16654.1 LacI family DNA-binding transcriptional regulator [Streptomyces sp. ITFR-21]